MTPKQQRARDIVLLKRKITKAREFERLLKQHIGWLEHLLEIALKTKNR